MRINKLFALAFVLFLSVLVYGQSQDTIWPPEGYEFYTFIDNGSFEEMFESDSARDERAVYSNQIGRVMSPFDMLWPWVDYGHRNQTPPTVHQSFDGKFKVNREAPEGRHFISMVTREDDSYECFGQSLDRHLVKGETYLLRLNTSFDTHLRSHTRSSLDYSVSFGSPVVLKVYGGGKSLNKHELLFESTVIDWVLWQYLTIKFIPEKKVERLFFEVYYSPDAEEPYNGNLLLDEISHIYRKTTN